MSKSNVHIILNGNPFAQYVAAMERINWALRARAYNEQAKMVRRDN